MDALWTAPLLPLLPLLLLPLLMWTSSTFVFYFKKCFYVAWMMCLALLAIPLCVLKSGGRDVENMRLIRSLVRHVKYFLGLRFDVSGWEHLQTEGPYVIISNHQSSLDVLGLMEVLPDRCTMIAKKELIYAGTVGLVCWLGGIVFINRKKTSDAKSVMAEAAKTMLDDQIRLWVFPEGTRNQKGDLLPFKKGAFHLAVAAQAPIIPIVFSSYSNFYLRKEKQFNSGTIRLKILPKIDTKGMTSDDVGALLDTSFNAMLTAFRDTADSVPQSNGILHH
ncbi:1-acyl-sn-glycerol-3-phosphate acyltransferase beta [Gadus morhua]|uniref:1-acyl-sn-glycerol-3-phosphate acyltransferase n=1 Tax=Gadus morhua TaxID=8049 RepID=A0A8C5F5S1_GADMO|nr:1-acyl-sn-glycerol-3-phosphate acyltransferase alpha-like [Gadus morhua]XP_056444305.1 1-acyl-sn-glycerol-3-phosphate acyltransferase beta [Gadus chalcogrammus]